MDISLSLPQLGRLGTPENVAYVARRAEQLGFSTGWVIDRVLAPLQPRSPFPLATDGVLPDVFASCLDPLQTLTFAAAHTSTIRLGTSVLNLPWYRPLDLVRRLDTLDVLSGGRLRIGFGTGWSVDEYRGLGVPFRARGAQADEALDALLALWLADPVEYTGEGLDVAPSRRGPRPVQQPHPPLYFGGSSEAALRRIARHGDGWMPGNLPVTVVAPLWRRLHELTEAHGRDPDELRLIVRANVQLAERADGRPFVGTVRDVADELVACADTGAHEAHLDLHFTPGITTAPQYVDAAAAIMCAVQGRVGAAAA